MRLVKGGIHIKIAENNRSLSKTFINIQNTSITDLLDTIPYNLPYIKPSLVLNGYKIINPSFTVG